MNIAIILPYLKAGGTERQASYIANNLSTKGYKVTIVCVERNDTFLDLFEVPVVYLNSTNSNLKIINNINRLSDLLVSIQADVVLSRAWNVNLLTSLSANKLGIPSVLFLTGSLNLSHHSVIKRKIHKYVLNKATKIISVSHKAKQNCVKWLKIDEKKIKVIHNGVDLERIIEKSDVKDIIPESIEKLIYPKIIFVGRLDHNKGIDLLINALSTSHVNGQYTELLVVGDGKEKPKYLKMVEEFGLSDFVHFLGEQKNPFPFMKIADLFVLPSRSEGFPNVLLEAMALGLPVIASNCETGPDEILNGKNGLLATPNSSESLKENINKLLSDEFLRVNLAEKGQLTVKNSFQLQSQLDRIEEVILQAVK